MSSDTVHIEIYLKKSEKAVLKYEVEDNDKNVLFSPYLFRESLKDFALNNFDLLRHYSIKSLKERTQLMQREIPNISESILYKINSLIKFIEQNSQNYEGIKVIF
jgi:hypothetical protein